MEEDAQVTACIQQSNEIGYIERHTHTKKNTMGTIVMQNEEDTTSTACLE